MPWLSGCDSLSSKTSKSILPVKRISEHDLQGDHFWLDILLILKQLYDPVLSEDQLVSFQSIVGFISYF